jgi:D-sedoheptulose 7-phosphate isomerase
MDFDAFFAAEFAEHRAVLEATQAAVREPLRRLVTLSAAAIRNGNKLMFFGNGGSAADAQNLATELAVRYVKDRPPIAAVALTTDSSVLTAIGNDLGFEQVFARQIDAIGRPGDIAVGITTSGRSANVLHGLEAAKRRAITPAAFTGGNGGKLPGLADPLVVVPSATTARIQEMHILVGQMLCGALEQELGLV